MEIPESGGVGRVQAMNRLGAETSPYLRQHADNPVDWWPWGPEALAEAARLDRPLLVSIGYSACHWCHVMAHESFEDPATAAVMNERFVNVKVDREERPDVDAVYMEAVQAMTGSGGWPLTAICTPDGRPFFTGTYFPNEPSHGRPSFRQLLDAIHEAWTTQRADLDQQASRVTEHLNASSLTGGQTLPTAADLVTARDGLVAQHDATWGGFGGSPKFPQTMSLDLLLRHHARIGGDPEALVAVEAGVGEQAGQLLHQVSFEFFLGLPGRGGVGLIDRAIEQEEKTFAALGQAPLGHVHHGDAHVVDEMRQAIADGRPARRGMRVVHPALGLRDIRVNTAPMTDDDGRLIGAAITLQDIHDDVDNRRKLEQFRTIADSTSDIIGVASLRPHADYLNPAGRSFFGRERI